MARRTGRTRSHLGICPTLLGGAVGRVTLKQVPICPKANRSLAEPDRIGATKL